MSVLSPVLVFRGGVLGAACLVCASGLRPSLELTPQESGTRALLQAVSPVDDDVVWLSGHDGTFVRTLDGGRTWSAGVVAGAGELEFRDVAAFDARTAYLMSSGPGALSRIYRTGDAGSTWRLQYTAEHPDAFLDCMDFWSEQRGLAYGDAVDGIPFLLRTDDGGESWTRVSSEGLPAALEGEGGFAASGTCLRVSGPGVAFVAMGNGSRSRVLTTRDWGETWTVADAPVVGGSAAGLTTVDVRADGTGIAVGGVIGDDDARVPNVALTSDGGMTWTEGAPLAMSGPAYGAAFVAPQGPGVVAVGPRGIDYSADAGRSWTTLDDRTWWAVEFSRSGVGWAVGPQGRVVRLDAALSPVLRDDPSGTILVANMDDDSVWLIDAATGTRRAALATRIAPHEVSIEGYERLHGAAFLPGDSLLALTSERTGEILVVSARDGGLHRALPTGGRATHMLALAGPWIYAANIVDGTVSRIDPSGDNPPSVWPAGTRTEGVAATPDGEEGWTGSMDGGFVVGVDGATGAIVARIDGLTIPYRLAVTPDGATVVVSDPDGGTLVLIDRARGIVAATIDVDDAAERAGLGSVASPQGFTLSSDGAWAFVSANAIAKVALGHLPSRTVVRFVDAGAAPDGIAFSPVPGR
jgi:photosystem II stability/assembly factor-like uncharacterized protein